MSVYHKSDLNRILIENLKAEMDNVMFYVDNISSLNYPLNKRTLDKLTMDSLDHAKMIATEILKLHSEKPKKANPRIINAAAKEESGLREVYEYELERTKSPEVKRILRQLIREESGHEELVKALK